MRARLPQSMHDSRAEAMAAVRRFQCLPFVAREVVTFVLRERLPVTALTPENDDHVVIQCCCHGAARCRQCWRFAPLVRSWIVHVVMCGHGTVVASPPTNDVDF